MQPGDIHTAEQFAEALDAARRRAARGTGRRQVSITDLARRTGIPRSTVHVYLTGRTLPPADALDRLLQALGVAGHDLGAWGDALERLAARPQSDDIGVDSPAPVPRQTPLFPPDVVGREVESARLTELLADPADDTAPLVVVLSGPGGSGKSTLAARWAAAHEDRFPDGTLWIDLHGFGVQPAVEPLTALGRLLRALGQPDPPSDEDSRADLFRSVVAGRRLLIVLDNAADSAHVRALLPGGRGCTVLVTSRSQLRGLVAETGADRVHVGPLPTATGVALLRGRGWPAAADPLAAPLVEGCGGLPLAIRILRERLAGRDADGIAELARALADDRTRLDVFEWADGDDPTGVRPVLQASHRALSAAAAEVFRELPACLGRGVEIAAVAAAAGLSPAVAARWVDELVAANLVEEWEPGRIAVPDLVATFAQQLRQDDPGAAAAADHRLQEWLLARTELACRAIAPVWDRRRPVATRLADDELPAGPSPFTGADAATTWLRENLDVVVGVAGRLLDRGRFDAAWAVLSRVVQGLVYRADLTGAFHVLVRAAEVAEGDGRLLDAALVWRALSVVRGIAGDLQASRDAALECAELAERGGNLELAAVGLANAAHSDLSAGRARACVEGLATLVALRARAGLPEDDPWVHDHLTAAHTQLGEFHVAARHADRNLELLAAADDSRSAAVAHLDKAWLVLERAGDPEEALALLDAGQEFLGDSDVDDNILAGAGCVEAAALLALGRHDDAETLLDALLPVRRRALTPETVDLAVVHGRLLRSTGRLAAAVEVLRAAVTTAARLHAGFHRAVATYHLADALAAHGEHESAREIAEAGLLLAQDGGYGAWTTRFADLLDRVPAAGASGGDGQRRRTPSANSAAKSRTAATPPGPGSSSMRRTNAEPTMTPSA